MYFKLQFPHMCKSGDGSGHFHDENASHGIKIGRRGKAALHWWYFLFEFVFEYLWLLWSNMCIWNGKENHLQTGNPMISQFVIIDQIFFKAATHFLHFSLPQKYLVALCQWCPFCKMRNQNQSELTAWDWIHHESCVLEDWIGLSSTSEWPHNPGKWL